MLRPRKLPPSVPAWRSRRPPTTGRMVPGVHQPASVPSRMTFA